MSELPRILTTKEKALKINLDDPPYGTLAEIGGGQEVAAHFFRVGAASGTIAKTMSAYDMVFSDAIYGPTPTGQYVSRARLEQMLKHEYDILVERLAAKRAEKSTFFSFANTVRAKAYGDKRQECHGWMGVKFQSKPGAEPDEIIAHVRLLDEELLDQQQALGAIGVNLIYAALYQREDLKTFCEALIDNLKPGRVEIDLLKFTGPSYVNFDNRRCALQLVASGLTASAYFTASGDVMQASEAFYKKPLLLLRGRFDPVTNVHLEMLHSAGRHLSSVLGKDHPYIEIMELSMSNLLENPGHGHHGIDHQTFLHRADILQALGKNVLISKFPEFHRLGAFLSRYTKEPVGIVLGSTLLEELMMEKWYEDLDGGILENFGRLFKNHLRLLVYPEPSRTTGQLRTAREITVAPHLQGLFTYLLENHFIEEVIGCDDPVLRFSPGDIRAMIEQGDRRWLDLVPDCVVKAVTKVGASRL